MNVIDLDSRLDFITNNLQDNLKIIFHKYGDKFIIKHDTLNIEVEFKKINHRPYNDIDFYRLEHRIEHRTMSRQPLIIDFVDPIDFVLNNNVCLTSIQRTETLSGTELVNLSILICKKFGVEKIITGDEATITCDSSQNSTHNGTKSGAKIDLSLMKLLEKKKTYYMNFGFKIGPSNSSYFLGKIKDIDIVNRLVNDLVDRLRVVQTTDIKDELIKTIEVIKTSTNKFDIIKKPLPVMYLFEPYYVDDVKNVSDGLVRECTNVISILDKYPNIKHIYKLLLKLFRESCDECAQLLNYLAYNNKYVQYNNHEIKRSYNDDFLMLIEIKRNCYFVYDFNKQL